MAASEAPSNRHRVSPGEAVAAVVPPAPTSPSVPEPTSSTAHQRHTPQLGRNLLVRLLQYPHQLLRHSRVRCGHEGVCHASGPRARRASYSMHIVLNCAWKIVVHDHLDVLHVCQRTIQRDGARPHEEARPKRQRNDGGTNPRRPAALSCQSGERDIVQGVQHCNLGGITHYGRGALLGVPIIHCAGVASIRLQLSRVNTHSEWRHLVSWALAQELHGELTHAGTWARPTMLCQHAKPRPAAGRPPTPKRGIASIKRKDDAHAMRKGTHFPGDPAAEAPSIDAKHGCIGGRGVGVQAGMQLRSAARGPPRGHFCADVQMGRYGFGCGS
mmetsp:Transcript_12137/g.21852  ORF Transcript_12137/g.21852 Transcript_12137/m.21852 type:complete len:328 (-) Transcript_12137:1160-2143(-)